MKLNGRDFYLALLKGEKGQDGMGCYVDGVPTDVHFSSDPQIQLDNLNNIKANKEDIPNVLNKAESDLSNVTYPTNIKGSTTTGAGDRVVETYIDADGIMWYRKWESGWKECGGTKPETTGEATYEVDLPIEFSNTNYKFIATVNVNTSTLASVTILSKTINMVTTYQAKMSEAGNNVGSAHGFDWYACGY